MDRFKGESSFDNLSLNKPAGQKTAGRTSGNLRYKRAPSAGRRAVKGWALISRDNLVPAIDPRFACRELYRWCLESTPHL
ncbi:hypothetical protein RRG08_008487 [Elysia crispata]|uniref:Uncharacterized protein n=1 Tax=Elysia crispata TaxID=231223 RepID=A0AAE0Z9Y9_9GAST|nr:hypothetical protein RRG08_008487 [Elysia crispata]